MSSSQLRARIAAMRAEASSLGAALLEQADELGPDELFELTGELQGVANAVDGAQLAAMAHAAKRETRLTGRGPVDLTHEVGFIDAMAASEVSLATGIGEWAAGRKVALAAKAAERFPRLLQRVMAGDLPCSRVQKVVTVCEGLDRQACASVEAVLVDRLADLDPARVTTVTRRVATRIAPDQVAAAQTKARKDRCVQVSPGPDGSTEWWALLPSDRSAAAWAAVRDLADTYAEKDPSLTADQARSDAFLDLLLTNVKVTARVSIGIPVITGAEGDAAREAVAARLDAENAKANATANDTGDRPVPSVGGLGLGDTFSLSAALSGCQIPGIGWISADTVEALLAVVPTDIGRALLDARTGTLVESVSTAYRPPKALTDFVTTRDGTCRMWGCARPAVKCDVDHARPWPAGPTSPANLAGLCRRHHRLKQRRHWAYHLAPDGTATWTSPTGKKRITLPDHAVLPPPPEPPPAKASVPAEPPQPPSELVAADPPPF